MIDRRRVSLIVIFIISDLYSLLQDKSIITLSSRHINLPLSNNTTMIFIHNNKHPQTHQINTNDASFAHNARFTALTILFTAAFSTSAYSAITSPFTFSLSSLPSNSPSTNASPATTSFTNPVSSRLSRATPTNLSRNPATAPLYTLSSPSAAASRFLAARTVISVLPST